MTWHVQASLWSYQRTCRGEWITKLYEQIKYCTITALRRIGSFLPCHQLLLRKMCQNPRQAAKLNKKSIYKSVIYSQCYTWHNIPAWSDVIYLWPRLEAILLTSPTLICLCIARSSCLIWGHRESGTYILEQAEHFCPPYSKAERMVPVTTLPISADLCTKWKFLPPHSG